MRRITILGATGSVGRSTIALLEAAPEGAFAVAALTAHRDVAALAALARRFRPDLTVVADAAEGMALREALAGTGLRSGAGEAALLEAASLPTDWTMAAIVGAAGLRPTLAALAQGKTVALANKEALVSAGEVMLAAARASGARLLPVDSEHNAIFQAMQGHPADAVEKIILTASGGPCRLMTDEQLAAVTPAQAVRHPVWSMGAKISVDSATMMNKGLEVIEAARLFGLDSDRIEVLVHPQSAVHGLVQFSDGSILAQLGAPDMRTPIAHCLAWPDRMAAAVPRLDLAALARLEFFTPDTKRFPALHLAREALRVGAGAPTILNAANEVAVAAFLAGRLGFLGIAELVERILDRMGTPPVVDLDAVLALDTQARRLATAALPAAQPLAAV
ncbi:1-deoxy-D-xylulose 5-phosphate reductoisomerase [Humitalea rosea]|uniref:1-deoxy-D-xylulose 5-phosphate reductoisomerase n=1 Tax=Humitalea rosea TaxID=990373 RepID=A0A2W7I9L3_9PROT|nr:1-deoxy-D-xylulose-5-phosphate reductoisomerase [Humitalea rosea]PZW43581.1 1-deoxy-D-xylulose 5-phosphate reductoisomerase [Humitalea rosea]